MAKKRRATSSESPAASRHIDQKSEGIERSAELTSLRNFATWALFFAAALVAYWPALRGSPLWDDTSHITRPDLQSVQGLWRIWFDLGATQQYYPLLHSFFWVEHLFWGDAVLLQPKIEEPWTSTILEWHKIGEDLVTGQRSNNSPGRQTLFAANRRFLAANAATPFRGMLFHANNTTKTTIHEQF
jgi:hypothetical protein